MSSLPLQTSQWRVPLGDLSQACRVLAQHLHLQEGDNRRVQWDLQPRVIRYYTTLGLLDRACEKRGKAMYYGARHLFQLLSIKKLQSQGFSLAEVQAKLLGASDQEMADFLEMPNGWLEVIQEYQLSQPDLHPPEPVEERGGDFWMRPAIPYREAEPTGLQAEQVRRFRLANGVEVVIPQETWERSQPQDWIDWLGQAPE